MTEPSLRRGPVHRPAASLVAPLLALVVLFGVGACGAQDATSSASRSTSAGVTPTGSGTATSTSTSSSSPSAPGGSTGATHSGGTRVVPGAVTVAHVAPRGLQPVRIQIPAIGVDATTTDLGIAGDGAIEVPSDPAQAGWLTTTPAPGQRGPAVIAGHVDSLTGPAVFLLLRTLSVGDPITVTRRNGSRVTFTVDGVRTYAKSAFPSREVYGPVPGPALRLITCGGSYVKADGGYQANVVVYAS